MLTLNKNSWHHKLACRNNWYYRYDNEVDFCNYLRDVFFGFIKVAFYGSLIIGGSFVSLVFIYDMAGVVMQVMTYGTYIGRIPFTAFMGFMFLILIMICLVSVFIVYLFHKIKRYMIKKARYQVKQEGFISLAYKKLRDKTCFKVQLK